MSSFLPPPPRSEPLQLPTFDTSPLNPQRPLPSVGGGQGVGVGPFTSKPLPPARSFAAHVASPTSLSPSSTHLPSPLSPLSAGGSSTTTVLTPISPNTLDALGDLSLDPMATSPASGTAHAAARSSNPLVELIETERAYVQDLSLIIKRVAAAFSRNNFPPAHLDKHFRVAESVYRANKGFLGELMSVGGVEPKSPKALGDLLMRWVDELAVPYGKYTAVWAGAGGWTRDVATRKNANLQSILETLPWPESVPSPPAELFPDAPYPLDDTATLDNGGGAHATLTTFFALPFVRLGYYKRLYGKLLKSTTPGRTDHKLLLSAQEKLTTLLDEGQARLSFMVEGVQPSPSQTRFPAPSPPLPGPPPRDDLPHLPSSSSLASASSFSVGKPLPPPISTTGLQKPLPGEADERGPSPLHSAALAAIAAGRQRSPAVGSAGFPLPPQAMSNGAAMMEETGFAIGGEDRGRHVARVSEDTSRGSGSLAGTGRGSERLSSGLEERSLDTGMTTPASVSPSGSMSTEAPSKPSSGSVVEVSPGVQVEQRVLDLEQQLDTSRCLDIFSMKPRKCKLQMAPPSLTYSRYIRHVSDASFTIRPSCDPERREVYTRRARLVLLTDLLMFCERISDDDRANAGEGAELWLMYPPLAGKHLRVEKPVTIPREGWQFEVTVMKREKVVVTVGTREQRDAWVRALEDAVDFGSSHAPRLKAEALDRDRGNSPLVSPAESARSYNTVSSGSLDPTGRSTRSPPLPPQPVPSTQPLRIDRERSLPGRGRSGSPPGPPKDGYIRPGQPPLSSGPQNRGHYPRRSDTSTSAPQLLGDGRWDDRRQGPSPTGRSDGAPSLRMPGALPPDDLYGPSAGRVGAPLPSPPGHQGGPHPRGPYQLSPSMGHPGDGRNHIIRKSPSAHSLGHSSHGSFDPRYGPPPPVPNLDTWRSTDTRGAPHSDGHLTPGGSREGSGSGIYRSRSTEPFRERHYQNPSISLTNFSGQPRNVLGGPSGPDANGPEDNDDSPPTSPVDKGPKTSILAASMRTKIFLKQSHSQWKSLGTAKLKVFVLSPGNQKQLVVEGDKGKVMISTIVLSDGVERVGRTGVAVDLSDKGTPTGIVYMLQMKTEQAATGLFEQLLQGSDRRSGAGGSR